MSGFRHLVLAEWTKLRSVRRWSIALVAAVGLTVLLSVLVASGSNTDYNRYPNFVSSPAGEPVSDEFHFAQQTLTGDGSIVAHVVSQRDDQVPAQAGIMLKAENAPGSRYVALSVSPGKAPSLQANFVDRGQSDDAAARWLRLTRSGSSVTAATSADGNTWNDLGTVTDAGLPTTVHIGLFVSSPPKIEITRQAGSSSVGQLATNGEASFDNVRIGQSPAQLRGVDIRHPRMDAPDEQAPPKDVPTDKPTGDKDKPSRDETGTTEADGVWQLKGSGMIGPNPPPDDIVQVSLFGIFAALFTLIAVAALFMTSEFKRDMLRTTFTAAPRRGRVFAAKALVLGVVAFLVGLVGSVTAFLVAQPVLRDHGWAPPAFPTQSLTDGPVLRAILTTSVFVAAVALLSLGVAAMLRHSATAITAVIVLVVLPFLLGAALPGGAAKVILQLTPAGGLATQRAKPPTLMLADPTAMLNPWWGLTIACLYAAAALAGAWWLLRRRDA